MAHTKTGGAVKGNRDSFAKRLGVKKFGGEKVNPGNILLRQRGQTVKPGVGVRAGRDYTLYAVTSGVVQFKTHIGKSQMYIRQGK